MNTFEKTEQITHATILVIDSIEENLTFLTEELQSDGYTVVSETSGLKAIKIAKQVLPDLILLDLMSIDIDGFEVCKILNNNHKTSEIPIILLSAREDIDDIINGFDLGAVDYIPKPFHYPIAAARIRSAIKIKKYQDNIRNINQQLETATTKALASEQSKASFLANMSHEIRTPLNAVLGISELLMDTQLSDKQEEYVKLVNSSGSILMTLLNDILDYSKFESSNVKLESIPFNCKKLVDEVTNLIKSNPDNANLDFTTKIDNELPEYLIGDPSRLQQILMNLISNGAKFTDSGSINIKLEVLNRDERRVNFKVSVTDSGIGIDEEHQKLLFQPFTQADESTTRIFGGTGLGLAICKETIELMQGEIGVSSQPGDGATFWFILSLKYANADSTDQSYESEKSASPEIDIQNILQDKLILVVEDNKPNALLVDALLKPTNAEIHLAENGQIALDRISTNQYDLILMDCHMPVLDGYKTTKIIRQNELLDNKNIIIAMTANSQVEDQKRCIDAGMDDYLSKPYQKEEFYKVIHKWALEIG